MMLYKTIFWTNFLFLSPLAIFFSGQRFGAGETKKWVVSQNSTLCVNGTTNVNKFACDILAYDRTDTLTIIKGKNDRDVVLSGNIALHVQSFDCHNSIMTRDLRKTLKEKQFPLLHINFLSLSKIPELTVNPEAITGMVDIEIAGTRKRFEIKYQVYVDAQKMVHLIGTRDVNFTEFNLIPPRKLGGIIQTRDKLGVDFHLKMKALN